MKSLFESVPSVTLAVVAALLASFVFSSCATTPPPTRPEVDIEPQKKTYEKGSLWPGAGKNNLLFSDNKASEVGDIVTVHIIEKTTAVNKANTSDEHNTGVAMKIDTAASDPASTPTNMELGGGIKFKGQGVTGRSDQFSATVSCIVMEVQANGNMVIEGQRRMQINEEEQYILIRGIVRPDDITYNNTILSSQIAAADIQYTGGGAMDGARKPGWLGRTFKSIWPF